jgi:hypothetical protein
MSHDKYYAALAVALRIDCIGAVTVGQDRSFLRTREIGAVVREEVVFCPQMSECANCEWCFPTDTSKSILYRYRKREERSGAARQ